MQRYAQTNVVKRTIFELIAEEIIKTMTRQLSAAEANVLGDQDMEPE